MNLCTSHTGIFFWDSVKKEMDQTQVFLQENFRDWFTLSMVENELNASISITSSSSYRNFISHKSNTPSSPHTRQLWLVATFSHESKSIFNSCGLPNFPSSTKSNKNKNETNNVPNWLSKPFILSNKNATASVAVVVSINRCMHIYSYMKRVRLHIENILLLRLFFSILHRCRRLTYRKNLLNNIFLEKGRKPKTIGSRQISK